MYSAIAEPDARLASRTANHHCLNSLTALKTLLWAELGGFDDPAVRQAVSVFSARLQALARVHRTLGEDAVGGRVDAAAHLTKVCAELCAAHLAPRGLHCDLRVDPGTLPGEVCQALDLIVTELVSHAATYAFLGRASGRIRVCLRQTAEGWICLVADNGCGPRGGDGMALVRGLAEAVGGDLCVHADDDGTVVTLSLPDAPFARMAEPVGAGCYA